MTTKFTNTLLQATASNLLLESDSADLKFAFEVDNVTKFLPAHKSVLARYSSVFRNMFSISLAETDVTINISDASYSEFEEFLQFFYREEVTLTMPNIENVVRLADKYDMSECFETCAMFMESNLTFDNLFLIYQLAVKYNIEKLSIVCQDKIQYSTLEMFDSPEFLDYSREMLNGILLRDGLACTEIHVFDACIAWAKHSCRKNELNGNEAQNVRQQLGNSFYLIRFRAMSGEEVVEIMTNPFCAAMFSRKELVEVLCLRNVEDFEPRKFSPKKRDILSFKLNKNPVMICRGGEPYYGSIQKESAVFFRSTVPALLNEIQFLVLPKLRSLTFSIKITENNKSDVLFNGSVTYDIFDSFGVKLTFAKVVVIRPYTVYRISIATDGINGIMPEVEIGTVDTSHLMKDIPLTFINDPSAPPPRKKCGVSTSIVKSLYFKTM